MASSLSKPELPGVSTVVGSGPDFRGEMIRSFRTYFDDVSLIEQMVDD